VVKEAGVPGEKTQFKCGLYCVFRGEDFSDFKGEDFPNDLQFDVMDERFYIMDTN
jgi:hypothetical protein